MKLTLKAIDEKGEAHYLYLNVSDKYLKPFQKGHSSLIGQDSEEVIDFTGQAKITAQELIDGI